MKILILGGKRFLGIALVEAMLKAGHTPTLFNRGITNPDLFPDVKTLIGDREKDLSAFKRRKWDAVIDTSGFLPRVVRESAKMLSNRCGTYVFISTVSVYKNFRNPDIQVNYPLAELEDPTDEDYTGASYGPLKALCEYEIQQNFKGNLIVIRPGLIVGPNDPTDRFNYWPWRVAQGGKVLSPGPPSADLQFIDVRDLANFILTLIEHNAKGVYNAVGPKNPANFGSLLVACREAAGSDASFIWADEHFLLGEKVKPWVDLPLWLPNSDPNFIGFNSINNANAVKAGLTFKPLSETVSDTLDWIKTRPPAKKLKVGLSLRKEATLIQKYEEMLEKDHLSGN
ncbi:NAD-dependent epimerase/dehydratase family protein [Chloroflexota bacterium]|nr:NAD-dependent epimerase/dehydratase family protein [Chloroflexota bacterium]